ncbi:MAG: tRNA preQ1(34) S-adenosylmethionine ribosyltransferase-isomerase QueA [Oscillospiraceae bacterium]|nr:tRNA preQ1(34) S-adenosylmethionine ribosyltransferase-isomerase QueA [Oscillospiraceae bacterium]
MRLNDFDFDLPEHLIAQTPIEPRDASRLLYLNRASGAVTHRQFTDIIEYLNAGDCLILNDSRVIPARLHGHRDGGTANIEVLLLRQTAPNEWECITRPGKKTRVGAFLRFDGNLTASVTGELDDGVRVLHFDGEITGGEMPLPPYIHEKLDDSERYQTVYASESGSAAAPTAGLHFTANLLDKLRSKGVETGFLTLHVGLGTFRPVQTEDIIKHKMHTEYYTVPQETADMIARVKKDRGRVIAVGTTACRALESRANADGHLTAGSGGTDIFITPGYKFKVIDGLITNFHLPKSTLIMLVSAFAGRESVLAAYGEAIREGYRFFSFGDCCFIL